MPSPGRSASKSPIILSAYAALESRYGKGDFNEMRKRMARVPHGASLVKNSVSTAPGFHIGNVFVLAGVPAIARAMLEALAPLLPKGPLVHAVTVSAPIAEGRVAEGLAAIQQSHPLTAIGSYPYYRDDGGYGVQLVARGRDLECGRTGGWYGDRGPAASAGMRTGAAMKVPPSFRQTGERE